MHQRQKTQRILPCSLPLLCLQLNWLKLLSAMIDSPLLPPPTNMPNMTFCFPFLETWLEGSSPLVITTCIMVIYKLPSLINLKTLTYSSPNLKHLWNIFHLMWYQQNETWKTPNHTNPISIDFCSHLLKTCYVSTYQQIGITPSSSCPMENYHEFQV